MTMIRHVCCSAIGLLSMLAAVGQEPATPRLSPLPGADYAGRISLCGTWKFNPAPQQPSPHAGDSAGWGSIKVPGEWTMQGFSVPAGQAATYERTFAVPGEWAGRQIKLRCNAVFSECAIYVNDRPAGSHSGGFTPFELDLTRLVSTGTENRIAIDVRSESLVDSLACASAYAAHPMGGILRDLYLFSLPPVNLSMLHVTTSFDPEYNNAVMRCKVSLTNESDNGQGCHLTFALTDPAGQVVPLNSTPPTGTVVAGATEDREFHFEVPAPLKWDCEHPHLYTLMCTLRTTDGHTCTVARRVGFRQIEVHENRLLVNGQPVKLHGVCYHAVQPRSGRSIDSARCWSDVELFRQGNVNYLRTSHYPPDEALLDACDALGMFVEVEAPFCWAHKTQVPPERSDVLVSQHLEMVNAFRSHPSVLIWSVGNESNLFEEYFRKAAERIGEIDPSRPRIFSQWKPRADGGMLELTNHHYPGPNGPKKYRNHPRPVIFDEYCHINAYNRLEQAADPGLRDTWGILLDSMWTAMYHSQGVLGGAIWSGIDDTFFLPDGKVVGYGTWGVVDGWRREKPEFWHMKKAYSPVRITSRRVEQDRLVLQLENRYLFSDLSECRFRWESAGSEGNISISARPGNGAQVEIALSDTMRQSGTLDLYATDPRGFEADRYCFHLKTTIPDTTQIEPTVWTLSGTEREYMIRSEKTTCIIDRHNGLLRAMQKDDSLLLSDLPVLMILPLNKAGNGTQMTGRATVFEPYNPTCTDWVPQTVACTTSDGMPCIEVKGTYREAEGAYRYRFTPEGVVEIDYDFTLRTDVSPRQTGIVLTLPRNFTTLDWERNGYWSCYPENHIGANRGTALAQDASRPISSLAGPDIQPSWEWADDQTKAGSNRFRSTKTNILRASLSANDGRKVTVLSDGRQHARAWIDNTGIRLLVADYNNAGSEKFFKSHAQRSFKPLAAGNHVKGTVRLRLTQ